MPSHPENTFTATLQIIGINPYVSVPEAILQSIFQQAGKDKGNIPICGCINGAPYTQTLVRYQGAWRLYVNMKMLKDSPKRIGEEVVISVAFDPADRKIPVHPKFAAALREQPGAHAVFETLRPSLQHEIVRYLAALKTEDSVGRNVVKAIDFLLGKGRFVGRDKP